MHTDDYFGREPMIATRVGLLSVEENINLYAILVLTHAKYTVANNTIKRSI
jgi:hypothetical protein